MNKRNFNSKPYSVITAEVKDGAVKSITITKPKSAIQQVSRIIKGLKEASEIQSGKKKATTFDEFLKDL